MNNDKDDDTQKGLGWAGDVLNRNTIGDFLYQLVLKKQTTISSAASDGALCFALDGDWGTGKTFFVDRWSQDISGREHPVIRFDAWANDLSEDPLVGFMAQVRKSLEPWLAQLPVSEKIKKAASQQLANVLKGAGKAVIPVGVVIAKGLVKKFTGVNFTDIENAVSDDEAVQAPEIEGKAGEVSKPAKDGMTEAALDKFFEATMKSHSDRQEAIQSLKQTIEELLTYLGKNTGAQLPLFVFIDELDRCRPDYAIRLLEGLKHLFDAKGVCFVVSTNLTQLSESVRSVYGAGFDGYRYLKRFFAFEYALPDPDRQSYARALVKQSFLSDGALSIESGLPDEEGGNDIKLAKSFAVISAAFDMDLRSQQQVFRHAEAAASALTKGQTLHCFYLFFLVAVLHYNRQSFEHFCASPNLPLEKDREIYDRAHFVDAKIPSKQRNNNGQGGWINVDVLASSVFHTYQQLAMQKLVTIFESEHRRERAALYPDSLGATIIKEFNSGLMPGREVLPSIAGYGHLVRSAGQIR